MMNKMQMSALSKIGNVYCPAEGALPSFKDLGCVEHADKMLAELPAADTKDLKLLLTLLYFVPSPVLQFLFWFIEIEFPWPGPIGVNLRKMRFGLKGISYALYYSGLSGANYVGDLPPDIIKGSTNLHHDKF